MAKNIKYPVEQIRQWIEEGKTQQWVADELAESTDPRIQAKLIYKVCKRHGIQCQRTGPRSGQGHPEWNNGKISCKNGYIKIYVPDHPSCLRVNKKRKEKANGGYFRKLHYVWEHRYVMESILGRPLVKGEVVHHIDGNTANNHESNLELFQSNAEHLRQTLVGKVPKWTEKGLANIAFGRSLEGNRTRANLRASILRASGASEPLSNVEIRRYLASLGKSLKQVSEMESLLELPPFDDRPKREHEMIP
jgi:hypothetical protein